MANIFSFVSPTDMGLLVDNTALSSLFDPVVKAYANSAPVEKPKVIGGPSGKGGESKPSFGIK